MGLFNGKKNGQDINEFIAEYLVEGEKVEEIYGTTESFQCLTNKRVMFAENVPLIKTLGIYSIPYKNIDSIIMQRQDNMVGQTSIVLMVNTKEYKMTLLNVETAKKFYNKIIQSIL